LFFLSHVSVDFIHILRLTCYLYLFWGENDLGVCIDTHVHTHGGRRNGESRDFLLGLWLHVYRPTLRSCDNFLH